MITDTGPNTSVVRLERLPDGKFAPGSGGRPLGSKNRISNEALTAVRGMKDAAIEQLRAKLERGDWDATVFVLSRIMPKDRPVELFGVSPSDIATALQSGEISPDEARSIATALSKLAEISEVEQLRERLAQLENLVAANGNVAK